MEKAAKKESIKVEKIAILAKLSDGTIRQIKVMDSEQGIWLGAINNFYNPVQIFDKNLNDFLDF